MSLIKHTNPMSWDNVEAEKFSWTWSPGCLWLLCNAEMWYRLMIDKVKKNSRNYGSGAKTDFWKVLVL